MNQPKFPSIEERVAEIAAKYAERIPAADRTIATAAMLKNILNLLQKSDKGEFLETVDEIQNMPTITKLIGATTQANQNETATAMRDVGENFQKYAPESRLTNYYAKDLPESVRQAMFGILVDEGEHSIKAELVRWAGQIQQGPDGKGALVAGRNSDQEGFAQAAEIRTKGIVQLYETIFPNLKTNNGVLLMREQWKAPKENKYGLEQVRIFAQKLDGLIGKEPFSRVYEPLKGATNAADVVAKLSDGSIPEKDLRDVQTILERELQQCIVKKGGLTE